MPKSDLCLVKGGYAIKKQGEYVAIYWKDLWLFKDDGSLVFHRKTPRFVEKIHFIDNERLLVAAEKSYHLVHLPDGEDIWMIPRPNKISYGSRRFAVTPDLSCAYEFCEGKKGETIFIALNTENGTLKQSLITGGLRATLDIMCDKEGFPCLLQSQVESAIYENGVRYLPHGSLLPEHAYDWKAKWFSKFPRGARAFLHNTGQILTSDLCIFSPLTQKNIYLLENEADLSRLPKIPPHGPIVYVTDESGKYLTLDLVDYDVIVDIETRKIVGLYHAKYVSGCIVGNEYWISLDSGVDRKPFPLIEEIAETTPKLTTLTGW